MTSLGRILIVDDDRDFVDVYRDLLKRLGLEVAVAFTPAEATTTLENAGSDVDVVLLDQKLQGPGGPDSGLDLIERIEGLAPFAKIIVVTGYARSEAVERAFRAGVYDYLVKNGAFEALLTAKVRNAIEVTRERRRSVLSREETVRELRSVWSQVRSEIGRNRKGALLEELVKLLFRATPGFERVRTGLKNEIEEIDVTIENRSDDPLWKQEGSYLLAECKNWSSPCDVGELRKFRDKMTTKYQRARVGFFIAPGGFTEPFRKALTHKSSENILVIPVDADDLDRWIEADDRIAVINDLHRRAVFDSAS